MVMTNDPISLVSSIAGDVASAIAVGGVGIGAAITKALWGRVGKLEDRQQANIQIMADAMHAHASAIQTLAQAVRDASEERHARVG